MISGWDIAGLAFFLIGFLIGLGFLIFTYHAAKWQEEKFKQAAEQPGRIFFGQLYKLGSVPKRLRKFIIGCYIVISLGFMGGCAAAIYFIISTL
jgi:hypothetical protein